MGEEFDAAREGAVSLDKFLAEKSLCLEAIQDLKVVAERMGSSAVSAYLSGLGEELSAERFYLAVLGSFKRGKSTLINALLGRDILPTGIIPLTSIVTKVRYGENTKTIVRFLDCSEIISEPPDLEFYVTERGNPGNIKNVAEVEIAVNSDLLQKGVVLVDTPGIGSTHLKNTAVTYDFLSKIDAAIFVLGVDPPISQAEIEFLIDIKDHVERIFFVQNKIDVVSKGEWEEAISYNESTIRKVVGSDGVHIYPLSAKKALESKLAGAEDTANQSGLAELDNDLREFLSRGRGDTVIRLASKRVMREAGDLLNTLRIERSVIEHPVEDLARRFEWLNQAIADGQRRLSEIEALIDNGVSGIMARFDDALNELKARVSPMLQDDLERFIDGIDRAVGPKEFAEQIEKYISDMIVETYSPFVVDQETKVFEELRSLLHRFGSEFNDLFRDIRGQVSSAFDIPLQDYPPLEPSVARSRMRFDSAAILSYESILPAGLPFLLPKPIYRRSMKAKAISAMIEELDKHGGRLRYDILYRLSESARKARSELVDEMKTALDSMQSAVKSGHEFKDKAIVERNARMQRLRQFEEETTAVVRRLDLLQQAQLVCEAMRTNSLENNGQVAGSGRMDQRIREEYESGAGLSWKRMDPGMSQGGRS